MNDLITVSKEDYLKAILERESEGKTVIPALLAHWLSVSAPAVTMAVKRLKRDGYVEVKADGIVRLTPKGRETATHTALETTTAGGASTGGAAVSAGVSIALAFVTDQTTATTGRIPAGWGRTRRCRGLRPAWPKRPSPGSSSLRSPSSGGAGLPSAACSTPGCA